MPYTIYNTILYFATQKKRYISFPNGKKMKALARHLTIMFTLVLKQNLQYKNYDGVINIKYVSTPN